MTRVKAEIEFEVPEDVSRTLTASSCVLGPLRMLELILRVVRKVGGCTVKLKLGESKEV